ncbi:gas vesicle protein GvpA [Kalymmatonema gypsitolerans NIES-4073]|nr:gas vesicle protein GvpA [Scytonema sp. NIES-4073]
MAVETVNSSSSLAEVIDRILDKGVVIDVWVRVSLVGIELLVVEARIVLASVETYLRYAQAVGLTGQAAVPAARAVPGLPGLAIPGLPAVPAVPGVPAVPAVPGVPGVPAVPAVPGVPAVQDYVSRTPIPSASSYATGVSPSQPSIANPTDVVRGIEL